MVDLYKIKSGDEVTVRLTVTSDDEKRVLLSIQGDGGRWVVPFEVSGIAISHTPKALAVGDRVKFRANSAGTRGEIVGVDAGWAWVRWADGTHCTYGFDVLERVS